MAPPLEYEAKNLDAAIKKACKKMKMKAEDLEYEVISHGSSGIFGLARVKKAKIRVILQAEEKGDKKQEKDTTNEFTEKLISEDDGGETKEQIFQEDTIQLGKEALERILGEITDGTEISVDAEKERLSYQVKGGNAGILIGRRGQTLEAIQLLVEKMINKKNKKRIRIQVDVEGYLENRKNNLKKLAKQLAQKAKRQGKPMSLGQMNAIDRRTVHLALKSDPNVKTKSSGEGYIKKLIIFPQKSIKNNRRHNSY